MITRLVEMLRRWCVVLRTSPERARWPWKKFSESRSFEPLEIFPWLVRHPSCVRNRFIVRAGGRTLCEELTTAKFARPPFNFRRGRSDKRVYCSRGQTELCVRPWYLVGQIDKDKRTSYQHEIWSDPSQDFDVTS